MRSILISTFATVLGASALIAQSALTVTHVQGNVYMISSAGPNLTVQIGRYGPIVVDTPAPALVPQWLAEIKKLSPHAIRMLLHTTASPEYISGDTAFLTSSH